MSIEEMASTTPAQNLEAERLVLGAMIMAASARDDAVSELTAEDFYLPAHADLFTVLTEMMLDGDIIEPVTVAAKIQGRNRRLDAVYIAELVGTPWIAASVTRYAAMLREATLLRRIAAASLRSFHAASTVGADAPSVAERAATEIVQAATGNLPDTGVSIGSAAQAALDRAIGLRDGTISLLGLMSGYRGLDELTLGFQPGQMVVVAARPSMGKSVVIGDVCRHAALSGHSTLMFSLEMSKEEVGQRQVAALADIPLQSLRDGTLTLAQEHAARAAQARLHQAPLVVDENPNQTIATIRARAMRELRKHALDLIAIDYLGLITHPNPRVENRQAAVADISRGLKLMARDLGIPVVVAAQLNRNSAARADKRPVLTDLRESGQVEADADIVILLHREDLEDPHTPRAGEIDLIVAKHRNGPTGTVALAHQFNKARLVDMYRD